MALSEQQIQNWSRALSETENDKCIKTVSAIRKVLEDHFGSKVKVFLQGSYANSTNVRQNSDVDIVVCYQEGAYYSDLSLLTQEDVAIHNQNWVAHGYNFTQFKNDVELLLRSNFETSVIRREKCIDIAGNAYRVNADVVPCFILKRFESPYRVIAEGVQLFSDSGSVITNFPDQHKTNGQEKNQLTNQKYKSVVRILKNCRNHLIDNSRVDEKFMPSFFLECLVWNVPDAYFNMDTYKEMANSVIQKMYNDMSSIEASNNYAEINNLMWLFRGQTKRTTDGVKKFLEHTHSIIN